MEQPRKTKRILVSFDPFNFRKFLSGMKDWCFSPLPQSFLMEIFFFLPCVWMFPKMR